MSGRKSQRKGRKFERDVRDHLKIAIPEGDCRYIAASGAVKGDKGDLQLTDANARPLYPVSRIECKCLATIPTNRKILGWLDTKSFAAPLADDPLIDAVVWKVQTAGKWSDLMVTLRLDTLIWFITHTMGDD